MDFFFFDALFIFNIFLSICGFRQARRCWLRIYNRQFSPVQQAARLFFVCQIGASLLLFWLHDRKSFYTTCFRCSTFGGSRFPSCLNTAVFNTLWSAPAGSQALLLRMWFQHEHALKRHNHVEIHRYHCQLFSVLVDPRSTHCEEIHWPGCCLSVGRQMYDDVCIARSTILNVHN